MRKKQLLVSLGLVSGLVLTGCNSGANSSSNPKLNNQTNQISKTAVNDSVANYPIGNILKYVTRSGDGTVTTYQPDAENGNGILGFFLQNETIAFPEESGIEAGKLTLLVPNSEKTYFEKRADFISPGEFPELGNPLAPDTVKSADLDYKNGAWQLAENGIDTGTHNMFFKYRDPETGDDVYFKLVSEVKTSSLQDLEMALTQNQGVSNVNLQNIYTEQPLKATIMTVLAATELAFSGFALFGPEFTAGGLKLGSLATGAKEMRVGFKVNQGVAKIFRGMSKEEITDAAVRYEKLTSRTAKSVGIDIQDLISSKYEPLSTYALGKFSRSVMNRGFETVLLRGGLGLASGVSAASHIWYLSTNSTLNSTDNSVADNNAAHLLSAGNGDSTTFTYRQVHLEPVSAVDVAKYPELGLKSSKSVTPSLGSTMTGQVVGFTSANSSSDAPSIMVSLGMLDTIFNPKTTKAPDSKNPNDASWLKEDGYLGNRMPIIGDFGRGKVNHYLDAAVQLRVMSPSAYASSTALYAEYGKEAAQQAGYKYGGYQAVAPDVSIISISNSNANSNQTLAANQYILEHGLSYVNKDGLKIYNPLNLQPGDEVQLALKNKSSLPMVNANAEVWNSDDSEAIFTAQKSARLNSDRQMVLAFNGCSNLPTNSSCNLTLGTGKLRADQSFAGVVEVSDIVDGNNTTLIPLAYNIKTVLTPSVLDVALGDDEVDGKFLNRGKAPIEDVSLDRGDLPAKATLSFKCYTSDNKPATGNQLPGNGYCKINVGNLGAVRSGLYRMSVISNGVAIQTVPVQL